MKKIANKISWDKSNGLVPAIIQDAQTSRVLMLGYMNKKSFKKTLTTNKVWFFSRTRKKLWMKGEKSKNYLLLKDIKLDCDNDTLLIKAQPAGPTCHLKNESCFDAYSKQNKVDIGIIARLFEIIEKRKKEMPAGSYTAKLFGRGLKKIKAKIMEEAEEVCRASQKETKQRVIEESVDVLYHLLVLLSYKNIKLEKILEDIKERM